MFLCITRIERVGNHQIEQFSGNIYISLFLLIILTKSTYYKTPSKTIQFLNFTHKLNKNNKISFLDVLIDTNNNNNFTNSTYKNPSCNNSCTLNFKVNVPSDIKKSNYS